MTDINVSALFNVDCSLISGSVSELGLAAADITWRNAMALAARHPLVTNENRDDVRDYFATFGAWFRDEIDAWTDQELSAMVYQEGASDMRHFQEHCNGDFEAYERDCERGQVSGRLTIDDHTATIYLGC